MKSINIHQDPVVLAKFDSYPPHVKVKMLALRQMIIETATSIGLSDLHETLKWGEPSYLVKKGSTIRMDWKQRSPHQYAIYFNCNSSLVPTFKIIYGTLFKYEKNRAILIDMDKEVPFSQLKECISMAMQYHSLKHLPLLGR